jgi:hypothetical protein
MLAGLVLRPSGNRAPPPGADAPAADAVLITAVQSLTLAGRSAGRFTGLPLGAEADWVRVKATLHCLSRAAY